MASRFNNFFITLPPVKISLESISNSGEGVNIIKKTVELNRVRENWFDFVFFRFVLESLNLEQNE